MLPEKFTYTSATSASSFSESPFRGSSGYYTYASPPQAIHGKYRKYRNNIARPRGAHDYYNMMYDPHIYRGRATTLTAIPPKSKNGGNGNENKPRPSSGSGDGNAPTGDNKYRKKRSTYYAATTTTTNGINRSKYKITTRVTTKTKGLTKLAPRESLHTHVQTEQFLQDLDGDLATEERDAVVQTDAIHDLCVKKRIHGSQSKQIKTKSGVDAQTQVLPGELFSFDEEVQPIVETMVGKILQQSLMETMEEEEIAALQEQQNRFVEKRKKEETILRALQEQQQRISQEKERLKLELKGESSGDVFLNENDRVILDQAIRNASINQPSIPTSYLIELLPSVLNSLRQEGYLTENAGDDLFSTFVPMWQSSSKAESEVGEPLTVESSGCISADPDEPSKLNVTSDKPQNEDEAESIVPKADTSSPELPSPPPPPPPPPEELEETRPELLEEDNPSPHNILHTEVSNSNQENSENSQNTPEKLPNGSITNFQSEPNASAIEGV